MTVCWYLDARAFIGMQNQIICLGKLLCFIELYTHFIFIYYHGFLSIVESYKTPEKSFKYQFLMDKTYCKKAKDLLIFPLVFHF